MKLKQYQTDTLSVLRRFFEEARVAGPKGAYEAITKEPDQADKVMHGILETSSGYTIMASDTPPNMTTTIGNNVVCSISGDDSDELHAYWERLAGSGMVSVPMDKQVWGDEFGACVDRFGVEWMVNVSQPMAGA